MPVTTALHPRVEKVVKNAGNAVPVRKVAANDQPARRIYQHPVWQLRLRPRLVGASQNLIFVIKINLKQIMMELELVITSQHLNQMRKLQQQQQQQQLLLLQRLGIMEQVQQQMIRQLQQLGATQQHHLQQQEKMASLQILMVPQLQLQQQQTLRQLQQQVLRQLQHQQMIPQLQQRNRQARRVKMIW